MHFGVKQGFPERYLGIVLGASMWLTSILALYNGFPIIGILSAIIAIWCGIGILRDLGGNPPGRLVLIAFLLILQAAAMAIAGASMLAGVIEPGKQGPAGAPVQSRPDGTK